MAIGKPYPKLGFGSVGEAVLLLQKALNFAPTLLPRLTEDASFGPKTQGRVMEFQGQKNTVRDGVVGPITWGELEPFVQQVLKMIDTHVGPTADQAAQRQRIVDIAEAAFLNWGWGAAGAVTPDGSPRIAAARGVGPSISGSRARQGGAMLASIYAIAQAGGANCLTISSGMETIYQQNPQDPAGSAQRRAAINNDIGSWCGIFAAYCYRSSGLKVTWDDVKHQRSKYFDSLLPTAAVQKGDIGVFDPLLNHHFLVVKDAAPGERVHSIDGNVGNPSESTVSPWNSVISRRFYLRTTLSSRGGKFLRPKFAAMIGG